MVWQKIVRHISDKRIIVESKSGNQYPVETEYDRYGESIYGQLCDQFDDTYWGFIEFKDEGPMMIDWTIGDEIPEKAPWEH